MEQGVQEIWLGGGPWPNWNTPGQSLLFAEEQRGIIVALDGRYGQELEDAVKWDKEATILCIVGVWLAYGFWIFDKNPKHPIPETGHVWPIPYHGATAYASLIEYLPVIAFPVLGALIALSGLFQKKR